jgi:hypothetical protein
MNLPRHAVGAMPLGGHTWTPGGGAKYTMTPLGVVDSYCITED